MKIVKDFILREIAGECVLVPTGETSQELNGMININASARFMWENVEKADSFENLVSLVLAEFEVEEERARRDVAAFVNDLVKYGFIVPTKEDKTW
jgi:hypothetical protein